MISYSTNCMGPVTLDWFKSRGLTKSVEITVKENSVLCNGDTKPGDVIVVDEITVPCRCGRIDIYGLDEREYYNGMHEYSVRPMKLESWNRLTDWLDELETQELWSYEQIIAEFESQCGIIEWVD